jgi:energy-coupling factor transporter ATP-binding protein EcfA2
MVTTTTKKEVLDYLWEWAENTGHWAKLLVKTVVQKEAPLSQDDLTITYNEFLKLIVSYNDKTTVSIERPQLTLTLSDLTLFSMSEIRGVNKLAEDQLLNFGKNITVIYGETASGKSGYSRILKAIGFSYEKKTKVLCNVYCAEETPQNAKIEYILDGKANQFVWDGACACPELRSISVFTNNCVNISLDSKRDLLVTPIGFHLFALVSNELDRLAAIHKTKITQLKKEIDWLHELNEGTKVHTFLKELSHKSKKEELEALAQFTDEDARELKNLEQEKRDLNKKLLETEITTLQYQVGELNGIKSQIESAQEGFSSSDWKAMGDHLVAIEELRKKEQKGLKEIAEQRGIEFYESGEFNNFIRAADEYLKRLGKDDYPVDGKEICIYCRQKLADQDVRELLRSYRLLLNDPIQTQVKKHLQAFSTLNTNLNNIDDNTSLHHASFGMNGEGKPVQPPFLTKFRDDIKRLKKIAGTKNKIQVQGTTFAIDYDQIKNEIDQKIQSLNTKLNAKNKSLSTIEQEERKLDQNINELKDQRKLKQKYPEVEEIITGLKTAKILNFRTDKARPILLQDISSDYALREVLSEGEQKAIALAEFLTEVQLEKSKAPLIFDDPVTSLDHKMIDEVARRLVALSNERQVVVFTHSIFLFNSIKHMSELPRFKDLEFKYYETETDLESTGILHESPTLKEDSFSNYKSKINEILNLPKEEKTSRESELAIEGYNKLRPAIEVLVEKEMFQSTVKRYRKNVALTSLEKVNGALIDKYKESLNDIFEKCCGYIDAHSSPDGLPAQPTLAELKMDFDDVCQIRKEFVDK